MKPTLICEGGVWHFTAYADVHAEFLTAPVRLLLTGQGNTPEAAVADFNRQAAV